MHIATMNIGEIERRVKWADETAKVRDRGNHVEVIFDAHGKSVNEATKYMKNIINLIRCPFKLTVNHGYNRGQRIMTAIRTEFCSARISRMYTNYWNPGLTHFWVDGDSYILAYSA